MLSFYNKHFNAIIAGMMFLGIMCIGVVIYKGRANYTASTLQNKPPCLNNVTLLRPGETLSCTPEQRMNVYFLSNIVVCVCPDTTTKPLAGDEI